MLQNCDVAQRELAHSGDSPDLFLDLTVETSNVALSHRKVFQVARGLERLDSTALYYFT